jgi:hypothetical protein
MTDVELSAPLKCQLALNDIRFASRQVSDDIQHNGALLNNTSAAVQVKWSWGREVLSMHCTIYRSTSDSATWCFFVCGGKPENHWDFFAFSHNNS